MTAVPTKTSATIINSGSRLVHLGKMADIRHQQRSNQNTLCINAPSRTGKALIVQFTVLPSIVFLIAISAHPSWIVSGSYPPYGKDAQAQMIGEIKPLRQARL